MHNEDHAPFTARELPAAVAEALDEAAAAAGVSGEDARQVLTASWPAIDRYARRRAAPGAFAAGYRCASDQVTEMRQLHRSDFDTPMVAHFLATAAARWEQFSQFSPGSSDRQDQLDYLAMRRLVAAWAHTVNDGDDLDANDLLNTLQEAGIDLQGELDVEEAKSNRGDVGP